MIKSLAFLLDRDNYRFCDSWESDDYRKINKVKKQRDNTKNKAKRIKSNNFTMNNCLFKSVFIVNTKNKRKEY